MTAAVLELTPFRVAKLAKQREQQRIQRKYGRTAKSAAKAQAVELRNRAAL